MIIQHNISALNAHRRLSGNNQKSTKNLQNLSSGYKINNAADDAAGLAISEKMRAQIKGLETAQKNSQDGISLVQTAEGALGEVHSMLNRMVELSTQSANGTYTNGIDRKALQEEVTALKDEIDRIAENTNFNGINLLDGSLSSEGSTAKNIDITKSNLVSQQYKGGAINDAQQPLTNGDTIVYSTHWTGADGVGYSHSSTFTMDTAKNALIAEDGTEYSIGNDNTVQGSEMADAIRGELAKDEQLNNDFNVSVSNTGAVTYTSKKPGTGQGELRGSNLATNSAVQNANPVLLAGNSTAGQDSYTKFDVSSLPTVNRKSTPNDLKAAIFEINGEKFVVQAVNNPGGLTLDQRELLGPDVNILDTQTAPVTSNPDVKNIAAEISRRTGLDFEQGVPFQNNGITNTDIVLKDLTFNLGTNQDNSLSLQVGDSSSQTMVVSVESMSTKSLGISELDISTTKNASKSIDLVKKAIDEVSSQRASLGAIQNRLEHTINNLGVTAENMTAAESRVRDADMAKEMMHFTKNNILTQSAQAMLAQANQQPQSILQMLR